MVNELVAKMRIYYSEKEEKVYGVLGIGIELTDLQAVLMEQEQKAEVMYDR